MCCRLQIFFQIFLFLLLAPRTAPTTCSGEWKAGRNGAYRIAVGTVTGLQAIADLRFAIQRENVLAELDAHCSCTLASSEPFYFRVGHTYRMWLEDGGAEICVRDVQETEWYVYRFPGSEECWECIEALFVCVELDAE